MKNISKSILSYIAGAVTVFALFVAGSRTVVANEEQVITPNDCQYPTRPLVDGQCDNSDPCDPMTLKDLVLHGDCADPVVMPEKLPTVGSSQESVQAKTSDCSE